MNLIRKTVLHVETTYVDGDKEATKPLKMVAAAAVIKTHGLVRVMSKT